MTRERPETTTCARGSTRSHAPIALACAGLGLALALASGRPSVADDTSSVLSRGPFVALDREGLPTIDVIATGPVRIQAQWSGNGAQGQLAADLAPIGTSGRQRAAITSAPPATDVSYELFQGERSLGRYVLRTPPAKKAKRFTFCALGDSGFPYPAKKGEGRSGSPFQAGENQLAVARLLEAQRPDLVLHTGDIVYPAGQPELFDPLFFKVYAETLSRVPFFTVLGNHDHGTQGGAPSLAAYPYPANENGNRYYSFDFGNAHFVALDSSAMVYGDAPVSAFAGSPQGKWLAADLAGATADWKIVFFHHPLYAPASKRLDQYDRMRQRVEELFHQNGVDLVVVGHDHFYARTVPVLRGEAHPDGLVHVVTGGGGASLYPQDAKGRPFAAAAERFHLCRFEIDGFLLRLTTLAPGKDGPETIDTATLKSRRLR